MRELLICHKSQFFILEKADIHTSLRCCCRTFISLGKGQNRQAEVKNITAVPGKLFLANQQSDLFLDVPLMQHDDKTTSSPWLFQKIFCAFLFQFLSFNWFFSASVKLLSNCKKNKINKEQSKKKTKLEQMCLKNYYNLSFNRTLTGQEIFILAIDKSLLRIANSLDTDEL